MERAEYLADPAPGRLLKVLVTGAGGFIGSAIVEMLLDEGHQVVACARNASNLPVSPRVETCLMDLGRMLEPANWQPLLDGVDGVVNAAGILREQHPGDFQRIHEASPWALAQACRKEGVSVFVQVSALGDPGDGEFVASKHRFDERLAKLDGLSGTVLRPSVVVSRRGSYGGTSLLRAMAALPGMLFLPGRGDQPIQPLWLEDLAGLVLRGIEQAPPGPGVLVAVGPETLSLRDYLLLTRQWLRLPPPRWIIEVPMRLVRLANDLGDWLQAGPLGRTMGRMLERGNVSQSSDLLADQVLGQSMQSVRAGLSESASFVQDRWQARLYLLIPLAWLSLVIIWLLSALSGFLADPADYAPLLDDMGVPHPAQAPLVLATASLNLVLAVALLLRRRVGLVLGLMLLSVFAYTVGLGLLAPSQWLAMTGGLLKNLAVIPLLAIMIVLENRR